jgi:hypothetical protein
MASVLDGKNFRTIAPAGGEIGIAGLELEMDTLAAGLAIVILELDFAINAPVGVRNTS